MPYLGNELATQFQAFVTQTITGDGSTGYTLDRAVANGKELLVYINNVKQEEGSGKAYTASGTTITFSAAVASTDSCYVVFLGSAVQTVVPPDASVVSGMIANANLELPSTLDMNGNELILDADADTSITADTDDQIDIRVGGSDQIKIATGEVAFNDASGDIDFRVESNGNANMLFVDGGNDTVVIGHNDGTNGSFLSGAALQVVGTAATSAHLGISRFSDNAFPPSLFFAKSRSGSIGTDTVVQADDELGQIGFAGADGTDMSSQGATIKAAVDATPGGNDMPTRLVFSTTLNGNATATERMRINHHGRISINATDDTTASLANRVKIDCNNEAIFGLGIESVRNTGGGGILITNNETSGSFDHIVFKASDDDTVGSVVASDSSTTYNTSSDYRLKENVSYDFDATTGLKKLKPARFNFKKDKDNTIDGFIAHEVSDIVPNAVNGAKDAVETYTDNDGKEQTRPLHQGIDHSKLVPLLVKTIQELEARIAKLESK